MQTSLKIDYAQISLAAQKIDKIFWGGCSPRSPHPPQGPPHTPTSISYRLKKFLALRQNIYTFSLLIIYTKQLLDSDRLKKECKICNTSAKKCNTSAKNFFLIA